MAEQMRELQTPKHEARDADGDVIEDRRGTTPFIKEMSMDAQKTVSRMIGVTQLLKHKRGGKEQAQLIQQLTAQARRLDTIRDLSDVDSLVTGTIALERRNTDLESLMPRRRGVGRRGGARRPDRGRAGLPVDRPRAPNRSSKRCFAARATARRPARRSPCGCCATSRAR